MIGSKELHEQLQEKLFYEMQMAQNGDSNYLDCLIELEQIKKVCDQCTQDIKDWKSENESEISGDAINYNNQYKGYKIELRSGRKIFDYSGIKEIAEKKKEIKEMELKSKAAFEARQKGILNIDEDGAEIDLPTVKYSASSIIVKKES